MRRTRIRSRELGNRRRSRFKPRTVARRGRSARRGMAVQPSRSNVRWTDWVRTTAPTLPTQEVRTACVSEVSFLSAAAVESARVQPVVDPRHDSDRLEAKRASFERMLSSPVQRTNPCPVRPDTFRQLTQMSKIAKRAFSVAAEPEMPLLHKGTTRALRTQFKRMACSPESGKQMTRAARGRR